MQPARLSEAVALRIATHSLSIAKRCSVDSVTDLIPLCPPPSEPAGNPCRLDRFSGLCLLGGRLGSVQDGRTDRAELRVRRGCGRNWIPLVVADGAP